MLKNKNMLKKNMLKKKSMLKKLQHLEIVVLCMIMKEKRKEICLSRKVKSLLFLMILIQVDGGKDP